MSDFVVPMAIITPIGVALAAAARAGWKHFVSVEARAREECDERIERVHEECAESLGKLDARVQMLEKRRDDCQDQLVREIQRGVELALRPPSMELPAPDWEESTAIRRARARIEAEVRSRSSESGELGAVRKREPAQKKAIVIDDEEHVATALHRILKQALPSDWVVSHETDPRIALSVILLDEDVSLAVVDLRMPRLDGFKLIEDVIAQRPELKGRIIVCTALRLNGRQIEQLASLGCVVIAKQDAPLGLESVVLSIVHEKGS